MSIKSEEENFAPGPLGLLPGVALGTMVGLAMKNEGVSEGWTIATGTGVAFATWFAQTYIKVRRERRRASTPSTGMKVRRERRSRSMKSPWEM